jgi:hypothetical protein
LVKLWNGLIVAGQRLTAELRGGKVFFRLPVPGQILLDAPAVRR